VTEKFTTLPTKLTACGPDSNAAISRFSYSLVGLKTHFNGSCAAASSSDVKPSPGRLGEEGFAEEGEEEGRAWISRLKKDWMEGGDPWGGGAGSWRGGVDGEWVEDRPLSNKIGVKLSEIEI
jgi:hypothetical protein